MIKENEFVSFVLFSCLVSLIVVGVWRFNLNPARFYDSDGSSLWKREMSFVEKKSLWPATTHYSVDWNGISAFVDSKKVVGSSWVEFVLWNGQGINSIEVRGVHSGSLLYPAASDVRNIHPDDVGLYVTFELTDTFSGRYRVIGVKPKEGESSLCITVTDVKGNITQDTVSMGEIM